MAAITVVATTYTTTNATSYTSASFTPANNDLLAVIVRVTGSSLAAPTLVSSAGTTFTLVSLESFGVGGTMYFFIANALSTNTAQTLTYDCTGDAATSCFIKPFRVSGMTRLGTSALRQEVVEEFPTTTTIDPVFASAPLTTNPIICAVATGDLTAALTSPSSFSTAVHDTGSTPNASLWSCKSDSGITSETLTWGGTLSGTALAMHWELDVSASATGWSQGIIVG